MLKPRRSTGTYVFQGFAGKENGIIVVVHLKEETSHIYEDVRIGGLQGKCFTETLNGLQGVAGDAIEVADSVVEFYTVGFLKKFIGFLKKVVFEEKGNWIII